MYENQVPVVPDDAGFVADYSLVVREAAKLNVTLSNAFNSMVFGFVPVEFTNYIQNDKVYIAVNNNGIALTNYPNRGYSAFYINNTWQNSQIISGDHQFVAINDSNIAVSNDGFFSQWDGTSWSEAQYVDDRYPYRWTSINNNNIVVSNDGYFSIYLGGGTWRAPGLIASGDISWFFINNNNLAIGFNYSTQVTFYSVYNQDGWTTGIAPFEFDYSPPNKNNIIAAHNGFFQYDFVSDTWTQLPAPSPITLKNYIITDQNLAILSDGYWTQWDGTSWSPIRDFVTGQATYAADSKGLLVGEYYSVEFLNLPMPTNNATITKNIMDAKMQLVVAFAAKYGAVVPYQ